MTTISTPATVEGSWHRRGWVLTAIGALVIVCAYATLALPGSVVDVLVEEDGPIEWFGALGLFVGAGLFVASFLRVRKPEAAEAAGLSRLGVWTLLLLGVVSFLAGGEEISWAQRLLGISTPESIAHINEQDETTLHNLTPFQSGAFDGDRLFKLAWMGLFVAIPLLAAVWPKARVWLRRTVPVVPLQLALLFVLAWVVGTISTYVFDGSMYDSIYSLSHSVSEIQESIVETLIGIAAFVTLRRVRAATERLRS